MKKLILLLLFIPLVSFGQDYGNNVDSIKLCSALQANNFSTDSEAEKGLDRILSVIGASKRFVLQPCDNIKNAVAVSYKGIRYIYYDREFMNSLTSGNDWGNLFILAHEVGHHINGHSVDLVLSLGEIVEPKALSTKRKQELEADEFAGFILAKLGGPIFEANRTISRISTNSDDSYSTHPSRDKRLNAVKIGFEKGSLNSTNKNLSKKSDYEENSEVVKNEIVYNDIYRSPIFPGCENIPNNEIEKCFIKNLIKHIQIHFTYPELAREMGVEGEVLVNFIVEIDGTIKITGVSGPEMLEKEAFRIISKLPKMKPGIENGNPVRVPVNIPINFKLQ